MFTLVTLPVEFNASTRAKEVLVAQGFVGQQEMQGVNAVLERRGADLRGRRDPGDHNAAVLCFHPVCPPRLNARQGRFCEGRQPDTETTPGLVKAGIQKCGSIWFLADAAHAVQTES